MAKLLLVEDDPSARTTMGLILQAHGYQVALAANGQQAIGLQQTDAPDAALVDLGLPDIAGTALLRNLREADPELVSMVVTGQASLDSSIQALNEGATAYVVKPVDMEQLLAVLRTALERQRLARENRRMLVELQVAHDNLRAAQQQLLQAEKLSALGQLISGIAHELNNPLTAVIGFAEYVRMMVEDPELQDFCQRIYDQARRCSRIVDGLLAFARQEKKERRPVQLNDLVSATLELYAHELRLARVEVERNLGPDLPLVLGDRHMLQQVILNLVHNARQALERRDPPRRLRLWSRPEHDSILLEIADNGPGIPTELVSKVFDPFFTTKPPGQGTGLGLSISYGHIADHGGELWVESEDGQGARFFIRLPALREAEARQEEPHAYTRFSGRRVLVIDDEEPIAAILRKLLTEAGNEAAVALSAAEARELLRRQSFDLVVCDIRMPEEDGRALYQALEQEWPEMLPRLVFCTGDTVNETVRTFLAAVDRPVLRKPFEAQELWRTLASVLEQSQVEHGALA